jgi:pyruvate/2-oxoglutarate dehydrogenase complex dihydrolipoamide acyltransferase (E2) component
VGELGQGVGDAAGQAVGDVGDAAGQLAGGAGQGVGGAGEDVGGLAGGLLQGGDGDSGAGGDSSGNGGGSGLEGVTAPQLAKEAVKAAAKQLGAVASDEAKDLSIAATRKVMELGDKRREKRADKHRATAAAMREAEDAGLDIEELEGTGADGRVTLRDVQKALKE